MARSIHTATEKENISRPREYNRPMTPRVSTLLRAVQRGNYGVLADLLRPSNRDHNEETNFDILGALLVEASGREHLDCIELLLQRMMKPSPKRNLKRKGYFPIHVAAGSGAVESIELLLSAGLSPRTRDRSGRTPLHHACLFHGSAAARCVSFLCVVARSTIQSRDRATGDTPLHFAVRARHGVCVEVLLAHAQEDHDILRESNAKGETPLDVAAGLGDNGAILCALWEGDRQRRRRCSHGDEGGGAGSAGVVDIQRILAVWERFFENAAVACVWRENSRPGLSTAIEKVGTVGSSSVIQLSNGQDKPREAGILEEDSWWRRAGQPRTTQTLAWDGRSLTTGGQGNGGGDSDNGRRSGYRDEGWRRGRGSGQTRSSENAWLLSGLARAPVAASAGDCSWGSTRQNIMCDQDADIFDISSLPEPIRQKRAEEELHIQLGDEGGGTVLLSSDDDDNHLFLTPRGGDDGEEVWLPENRHGEIHPSLEPPTPPTGGSEGPAETVAISPHSCLESWIACWDAASESVYYWESRSGELTWNAPTPAVAFEGDETLHEPPSRVWDPQREAFFMIDEDGTSHWLDDSSTSLDWATTAVGDDRTMADGAAGGIPSSVQYDNLNTTTCFEASTTGLSEQRSPEEAAAAAAKQPSREGKHICGTPHDKWGDKPVRDALLLTGTETGDRDLRLTPHSLGMTDRQNNKDVMDAKDDIEDGEVRGFYDAQDHSSMDCSFVFAQADAGQEYTLASIDSVSQGNHPTRVNDHQDKGRNKLQTLEGDIGSHIESASTEADPALLRWSAWVQWCPHSRDVVNDTPPYFVNQETGVCCWVLPPEAVVESRGWLRAWSEEHQARFFANQWTGRVSWELDREAET